MNQSKRISSLSTVELAQILYSPSTVIRAARIYPEMAYHATPYSTVCLEEVWSMNSDTLAEFGPALANYALGVTAAACHSLSLAQEVGDKDDAEILGVWDSVFSIQEAANVGEARRWLDQHPNLDDLNPPCAKYAECKATISAIKLLDLQNDPHWENVLSDVSAKELAIENQWNYECRILDAYTDLLVW